MEYEIWIWNGNTTSSVLLSHIIKKKMIPRPCLYINFATKFSGGKEVVEVAISARKKLLISDKQQYLLIQYIRTNTARY